MDSKEQYSNSGAAARAPAPAPTPVPRPRPEQYHPASLYPPETNQDEHDYEKLQYAASPPDGAPPSYSPPASAPYPTAAAAAAPSPYPAPAAYPAPGPQQYPPPPSSQYPPPAQPYPGQVPYGQPPAGYPPGYAGTPQYVGSPPPPPAQQQQQVVVVSAGPQYQPVAVRHVQSYVGEIVFSCFVAWCCDPLFGLVAFILAVVASTSAVSDPACARRLGHASIGVSVAAIVINVIAVIIIVSLIFSVHNTDNCAYTYNGACYSSRTYVGTFGNCYGLKTTSGYCYSNIY